MADELLGNECCQEYYESSDAMTWHHMWNPLEWEDLKLRLRLTDDAECHRSYFAGGELWDVWEGCDVEILSVRTDEVPDLARLIDVERLVRLGRVPNGTRLGIVEYAPIVDDEVDPNGGEDGEYLDVRWRVRKHDNGVIVQVTRNLDGGLDYDLLGIDPEKAGIANHFLKLTRGRDPRGKKRGNRVYKTMEEFKEGCYQAYRRKVNESKNKLRPGDEINQNQLSAALDLSHKEFSRYLSGENLGLDTEWHELQRWIYDRARREHLLGQFRS